MKLKRVLVGLAVAVPLAVVGMGHLLFVYFHPGVRSARDRSEAEGDAAAEPEIVDDQRVVELDERRRARGG